MDLKSERMTSAEERLLLDAVVEMSVDDGLPSPDEVRQELTEAGLVPGLVGRRLRERIQALFHDWVVDD